MPNLQYPSEPSAIPYNSALPGYGSNLPGYGQPEESKNYEAYPINASVLSSSTDNSYQQQQQQPQVIPPRVDL